MTFLSEESKTRLVSWAKTLTEGQMDSAYAKMAVMYLDAKKGSAEEERSWFLLGLFDGLRERKKTLSPRPLLALPSPQVFSRDPIRRFGGRKSALLSLREGVMKYIREQGEEERVHGASRILKRIDKKLASIPSPAPLQTQNSGSSVREQGEGV